MSKQDKAAEVISWSDHMDAARLAHEAGQLLLGIREQIGTSLSPEEARHLGDTRSHQLLAAAIGERYPHDGLLSEEGKDGAQRLSRQRVWIIDPLDGTREFGEPGRQDWAVHVALALNGQPLAGAVALPALAKVFSTAEPPQVTRPVPSRLRLAVSRTRPPASVEQIAHTLGADLVPMGSAGAKVMAIVRGEADVYLHSGGQYEWDTAAPVAVAKSAGLHASRIDGSALLYNRPDPWLPDVLICLPDAAGAVLAAVAEVAEGPASQDPRTG